MTKNGRRSSVSPHIILQQLLKLYGKSPKKHSKIRESLNRYYI